MIITPKERETLKHRIETNQRSAWGSHAERIARWKKYLRQWHNRTEAPAPGDEQNSNFQVPYTQGVMYSKWSKWLQSLFGDDAEIIAQPSGQTDAKVVGKVGKFCTVAFLRMMPNAMLSFSEWAFKIGFYGRGFVFRRWAQKKNGSREVCYEGPEVYALDPEDVVTPAEEQVKSLQDFTWVHRLYWLSPDELIEGMEGEHAVFNFPGYSKAERDAAVQKIIKDAIQNGGRRDLSGDEISDIADEQASGEGVQYSFGGDQGSERIRVCEAYMHWRPLKSESEDAEEMDLDKRELVRERIRAQFFPRTGDIAGLAMLGEVFEKMSDVVPIDDGAIGCDGRYWTMGVGRQSFDVQEELSAIHNSLTDGMDMSIGPHVFYEAGSGLDPANTNQFTYGPKQATQVTNANGIKTIDVKADVNGAVALTQLVKSWGEFSSGQSDASTGRASDRPNAPKTLGGQMLLVELGDVRAWIDLEFLRIAFSRLVRNLWEMYVSFGSEDVFFRITEEEANGLFEVHGGGAVMTAKEFAGRYDFTVKFATSAVSKEARKAEAFQGLQVAMGTPLVQTNARAQWVLLNRLWKVANMGDFSDVVPEPPDLDTPLQPRVEHAKMQQGELVTTHPQDNDKLHMIEHKRALERARQQEQPDTDYVRRLTEHLAEHRYQDGKKMLMSQLVNEIAQTLPQAQGVPGLPGATPPQPGAGGGGAMDQILGGMENGQKAEEAGAGGFGPSDPGVDGGSAGGSAPAGPGGIGG